MALNLESSEEERFWIDDSKDEEESREIKRIHEEKTKRERKR
jgi:hypothetical protein